MSLTTAQTVDVRRFMGYSVSGDSTSFNYRELLYSCVSYMGLSLDYRLQHLQPEEEAVVASYLVTLNALEQAILSAADNLDTDSASVWTRNKNEIADREKLFRSWRLKLCDFLGFAPGLNLATGSTVKLIRS